jgi:hypothetical protein
MNGLSNLLTAIDLVSTLVDHVGNKIGQGPGQIGDTPAAVGAGPVLSAPALSLPVEAPAEVEDYQLRDHAAGVLLPILGKLGYVVKPAPHRDANLDINCVYTSVSTDRIKREVLQFAPRMMNRPSKVDRLTLHSLPEVLGKDAVALVFCEELDAPILAARKIILDGWAREGIRSVYIPWRDVRELDDQKDETERKYLISEMLGLSSLPGMAGTLQLDTSDIQNLVRILSGLSFLEDLKSQEALLFLAGLIDLKTVLVLQERADVVAAIWINALLQKGELPDRKQALGALLEAVVRNAKELASADKDQIDRIIDRYKLLP